MASTTIGLDPNRVDIIPSFGVNQFGDQSDKQYVYCRVTGAIGEKGEVVAIENDGDAAPLTTTIDLIGRRCGIAPAAAAINSFCWMQVRGETEFLAAANCNANSTLRATTTGGVVDDSGSGPVLNGLTSTEAAGTMQKLVTGRATWPILTEATAGGGGGTTVTANPGGTSLTALKTITIGSTDYSVADINDLTTITAAALGGGDLLVIHDKSDSTHKSLSVLNLSLKLAGQGITASTTAGVLNLDPSGVTALTEATVAGGDQFFIRDHSATAMRHITLTDLADKLAGTNITANAGVLSAAGGGGGGTTVVANPGGTGLTALTSITIGTTSYSVSSGGGGTTTFLALTDTPTAFGTATQILQVNTGGTALEFADKPAGAGATTFLALTDTPSAIGTATQILQVNAGATALEYADKPTGGGTTTIEELYDNTGTGDAALTADMADRSWANANCINMTLTKPLAESDDNGSLHIAGYFTAAGTSRRHFSLVVHAKLFRLMRVNTQTSGRDFQDSLVHYMARNSQQNIGSFAEMGLHFTRARDGANDQVKVGFASNNDTDIANWRCTVSLCPW